MFEPRPLGLGRGHRSDRHGVIERHPTLALLDQFSIREISRRTGLSGSNVTEDPARSYAHSVVAIHLTDVPFWNMFQKSTNLSRAEAALLKEAEQWQKERGAYAMIQGTRPATAAVGLGDSPSGLSAWIVEKNGATAAVTSRRGSAKTNC